MYRAYYNEFIITREGPYERKTAYIHHWIHKHQKLRRPAGNIKVDSSLELHYMYLR